MKNTPIKSKSSLLAFSTKSYPTFGRQKKEFEDTNPLKSVLESPYFWWYMFAKLNEDYKRTCKANGRGKHAKLYKDFGNIHTTNFKDWWQQHVELFAEPKPTYRMQIANSLSELAPFNSEEVINLVVPLNRSQRSLKKAFSYLVLKKVERGQRGVSVEASNAKYKLSGKWHIEALKVAYKIYTIKQQSLQSGKKKTWADIAIEVKLPMSFSLTKESEKINSDVKRTLTILAKRHYDRAEQFIASAISSSFPYKK